MESSRESRHAGTPWLRKADRWPKPGSRVRWRACLLTYARGEGLSTGQLAAIRREGEPRDTPATAQELLAELRVSVEATLDAYRATPVETLSEPREVGRARLPSTVLGLLFHAAEHARRHSGQVVATARIIRGLGLKR